jgi:hypothetical protein
MWCWIIIVERDCGIGCACVGRDEDVHSHEKKSLGTSVLFLSAWTIVIENPSGGPTMGRPAQRCCIMKPRQGNSHKSIVLEIHNEMVRTKMLGTYKICSWRIVVEWGLNSRKSSFQHENTNAWMFIKKNIFS